MRQRFWIGLIAVLLIAAGSVAAAIIVYSDDRADFDSLQREEAIRAARQTEAVAALSIGELDSAAAFFQAERDLSRHEFGLVARSLLEQDILRGAGFIARVPASERRRYEAEHGFRIVSRRGERITPASGRDVYFPLTFAVAKRGTEQALGYDLGSDASRLPVLRRARDTGKPVVTPVVPLYLGGDGVVVYNAIYRDGAPTATVAQRRAALLGFASGSFALGDLTDPVDAALPDETDYQLRISHQVALGPRQPFDDPAAAQLDFADRTWVLVVRDPNRPNVSLPLLLAVIGISLAALLGTLIVSWRRNERMQQLEQEASHDALTGLKNRRRFEEDLRAAMARSQRDGTTGALLMLDLDNFKHVNDTHGHPAGDRLIEEIASVLRRRTRGSDSLARLGGDEFAIVLPRCDLAEARVAAEAIAEAIRLHKPEHDGVEPITASVGVAMFGEDPRAGFATIVAEADTAMYSAKDGGRDGVRVFDPEAIRDELLDAE
ncbi:MAG TPA: diguanylate cyclase [Solirubrobacterales bacterium]|nr:diguanylate cyclase [Solirubrobacterales bacterium]